MTPGVAGDRVTRFGRCAVPRQLGALACVVLATLLGVLLAVGGGASPALAHAELLGTTPENGAVLSAAPAEVELRFNEPVQLVEGATRLFPGDGEPVELDAKVVNATVVIELPAGLDDGAYALGYRVVSADGHPVGGAITFQVGEGSFAAPDTQGGRGTGDAGAGDPVFTGTLVSLLTFAQYLGLLAFAGLLFFEHWVLRAGPRPGRGRARVLRWELATAIGASLLLLPVSGARVAGREIVSFVPESGDLVILPAAVWLPGVAWQAVAVAGLATLFGLIALSLATRSRGRAGRSLAVAAAGAAVAAPLLVGHTQTVQPAWLMQLADLGHLLTGAFWIGGVIGLLLFLAGGRRTEGDSDRTAPPAEAALAVVARFSRYALGSVLVLAASGAVMGVLIVGSVEALLTSGYGRLLLLKLGIVAVVVALAALNRLVLLPRIGRAPGDAQRWARLRRTLAWEAGLIVAVLAVTGFLTNTSPSAGAEAGAQSGRSQPGNAQPGTATGPGDAGAEPAAELTAESQGLAVAGTLSPAAPGSNTFVFQLEYEGESVWPEEVRVEARLPEQQLGPLVAVPELSAETGEYSVTLTLPIGGDWQLYVLARIDTYTQPIAVIPVTLP